MVYSGDAVDLLAGRAIELDLVGTVGGRGEAPASVPSGVGVKGSDVPSAITSRPPAVAIVGWIAERTSVPLRAATSPPSSTVRGSSPVYDGEVILEIQLLDVRQFDNLQGEGRRIDAGRFDVVLEPLREIEQHPVVRAVFGANHREPLDIRRLATCAS